MALLILGLESGFIHDGDGVVCLQIPEFHTKGNVVGEAAVSLSKAILNTCHVKKLQWVLVVALSY